MIMVHNFVQINVHVVKIWYPLLKNTFSCLLEHALPFITIDATSSIANARHITLNVMLIKGEPTSQREQHSGVCFLQRSPG